MTWTNLPERVACDTPAAEVKPDEHHAYSPDVADPHIVQIRPVSPRTRQGCGCYVGETLV